MNYYNADDKKIRILGRTTKAVPTPIFWTASGAEFVTDSSQLWIDIEADYTQREIWVRIEIDGFCMQRLLLQRGRNKICAFFNLPKQERHIRFMRETQPMQEDETQVLLFYGVECDGELCNLPEKKLNIEFIGDSLSSGEGLGGAVELKNAGSAVYGLGGHYAIKTADKFNADFRILSQSGWGVHSSCFNDFIRIMPKYYHQVCGVLMGEKYTKLGAYDDYDFSSWTPDIVVINLGSNDGFALDREAWIDDDGNAHRQITNPYGGVEEQSAIRFENAVVDFLKKVRLLNPNAFIIWAYGMCDHTMQPYLDKAMRAYISETNDERAVFQLLPATNMLWVGSSNHPGVKTHELASEVLSELIGRLYSENRI